MAKKIFIVGCGAVGMSLGKALSDAGREIIGVFDTDARQAGKTAELIGVQGFGGALPDLIREADSVLVTVPDGVIGNVAALAEAEGLCSAGQIWIHCSGQLSAAALSAVAPCVRGTGTMHPAFVFPPKTCTPIPEGVYFATGGNPDAVAMVHSHVAMLKGHVLELDPAFRPAYHAAMVMASNYVATLMESACVILRSCGVDENHVEPLLLSLTGSAVSRAREMGVGSSLSGPIRRGDMGAVEAHLRALGSLPEEKALYLAAGKATVRLAAGLPGYCPDTAETLMALLDREQRRLL